MGLHRLDFFSNSPKNFIFQNTSNKTNFGGVLTLIYIIFFLCIIFYYIIDYILKEEYSVEYSHYEESVELLDEDETSKYYYNEKLNPYLEFNFQTIIEYNKIRYVDNIFFILVNDTNNQSIPINTSLYKKVTDINLLIIVNETNYVRLKTFQSRYKDSSFSLDINYKGYVLDHQNDDSPLHPIKEGFICNKNDIKIKKPTASFFYWNLIKYKADAGIKKLWNKFINKKDEESLKTIGLCNNQKATFSLDDFKDIINEYPINGTNLNRTL